MRYVIVIVGIALLVIWDGFYNGGHYTSEGIRGLRDFIRTVTG